jgi:indolepyruvate ferredoxin oxidoreductase alpha subunit
MKLESYNKKILTGNEAIAFGALEAGIGVATSYPGAPISGILESICEHSKRLEVYAEWSINEKVALEIAAGASYAGVRSLCSMKHLGLNVALDTLGVIAYTGVNGGLVIIVGDDPEPTSSQTAVDTRYHAILSKVPCLEPTNGQEAKDIVLESFKLSEKFKIPVIVRITPMIAHSLFVVEPGKKLKTFSNPKFIKDSDRYICLPHNTKRLHSQLNQKEEKISNFFAVSKLNRLELKNTKFSVLASGFSYNYVKDALEKMGLKANVLKLLTTNPIPKKIINELISVSENILIVEELEPIVEIFLNTLAFKKKFKGNIFGKLTKHIPRVGELNTQIVIEAICDIHKIKNPFSDIKIPSVERAIPSLCAGCPHRSSYYALHKVLRETEAIKGYNVIGDRGCYNIGAHPPLNAIDVCLCMGSSISIGYGLVASGVKEKIVSVIGDSTFFHSGIHGLINAMQYDRNMTIIIMDNDYTSMTGNQSNPGTGFDIRGDKIKIIDIEELIEAIGVKYYRKVDPYDLKLAERAIKEALKFSGLSVVHMKRECALISRKINSQNKDVKYEIKNCKGCMHCINYFACPALYVENGKVKISQEKCTKCGACLQICPFNAIKKIN